MDKDLLKKCKQCINYNKVTKQCNYYNELAINKCIYCEVDKRKICALCDNYDKETSYCKIAQKGKFKAKNTLRICNNFIV